MKTHFWFLFVLATLPISVHAELVVYRESERARVTVAGHEVAASITTYIVYDNVAQTYDAIGALRVGPNKFYAITNTLDYSLTQGIPGRSGNYTVLSRVADSSDNPDIVTSSYFAKGRETTLDLGNGANTILPRSMKAVTRAVQFSGGQIAIYESSSTLIFQSTETRTANDTGDTAAAVIERIRLRLVAQGYVPAP